MPDHGFPCETELEVTLHVVHTHEVGMVLQDVVSPDIVFQVTRLVEVDLRGDPSVGETLSLVFPTNVNNEDELSRSHA